jgi:hypothetical protein
MVRALGGVSGDGGGRGGEGRTGQGRAGKGEIIFVAYLARVDVGGASVDFDGCCGCEGGDERGDDDCGAHFEGWEDEVEG